jgi:hypothetical protein
MASAATIGVDLGIDAEEIEKRLETRREEIERDSRGALAHLSWPMVRERLAIAIRDEVGRDLMPWMAQAWTIAGELHQFKDTETYPAGQDAFYDMIPHSIEGLIHPQIFIRCAGQDLASLRFDVKITAAFKSVALIIRDARIIGFGGGEYLVGLNIGLDGNDLGGPIELERSRLPVRYAFEPGLPIL